MKKVYFKITDIRNARRQGCQLEEGKIYIGEQKGVLIEYSYQLRGEQKVSFQFHPHADCELVGPVDDINQKELTVYDLWMEGRIRNFGAYQTTIFNAYSIADSLNKKALASIYPQWFTTTNIGSAQ